MRIRTQLILAFLLLAVVPLAAMVLWSYVSSERAVRRAVEAEARALAHDLGERMAAVRRDLASRFARLSDVPFGALAERGGGEAQVLGRVAGELGELGPLVDALEYVPRPLPPPAAPLPSSAPVPVPPVPPAPPVPAVPAVGGEDASPPEGSSAGGVDRFAAGKAIVIRVAPLISALRSLDREAATRPPGSPEHEALAEVRADVAREVQKAMAEAAAQLRAAQRQARESAGADAAGAADAARVEAVDFSKVVAPLSELSRGEREALVAEAARAKALLGATLDVPIERDGTVVGTIQARLRGEAVVRQVLARTRRDQGEMAFAVDSEGTVYTASEADRKALAGLPLAHLALKSMPGVDHRKLLADWTVVTTREQATGLVFGIARPIGKELVQLRRTALLNLLLGAGVVGIALLGVLPLSGRLARGLSDFGLAAERVAQGDLTTRVPTRGPREVRQLAGAFNRMAEDLSRQQERLLEEERLRREEEVAKRLLAVEVATKTAELEEARAFQLSLLPKALPHHPALELGVFMRTATEVGGDYYDFLPAAEGALVVAIGDATGHGVKAGSMVMAIKSLLVAQAETLVPAPFLCEASRAIKRMDLARMAMGLALLRVERPAAGEPLRMAYASAGMPPVFVYRAATGGVEEVGFSSLPLGSLSQEYEQRPIELLPGDTALLLSDGFPELPDEHGEPLGYAAVRTGFADAVAAEAGPRGVIGALAAALDARTAGRAPADDVTFVVLHARRAPSTAA